MEYRALGKTGLLVSALSLGTVELGVAYGIKKPGEYGKPDRTESARILKKAVDSGINLFDTAPAYGESENLLGDILGGEKCYFATKINIPPPGENAEMFIEKSLLASLKNLKRDALDIVQIHNATVETILHSDIPEMLLKFKKKGIVRFIGASVYEPENAIAALDSGYFDVLQIAYNILDQRMRTEVFPEAVKKGVGIISRSAYLKGVLTEKADFLDDRFSVLKEAAGKIKRDLNLSEGEDLTKTALRFCFSTEGISSVLAGVRSMDELAFALETEKEGRAPDTEYNKLLDMGIADKFWLNPANWPEM
ncbi:MAG: aldo/keto reductase [bacterium]